MTEQWQPVADDFDFVVATATGQQAPQQPMMQQPVMQQTPIQQHFTSPNPYPEQVSQAAPLTNPGVAQQVTVQPIQQPQPAVQDIVVPVAPVVPAEPAEVVFDLDSEIDNLMNEFGIGKPNIEVVVQPDNKTISTDNDKVADDNKSIAKQAKISIILEKLVTERDSLKDDIGQERYEKEQYKMAAKKLQNKLSEVIEQKTALEYDENKLQVNDDIKDFVHFYNKRSWDKTQQTSDSVLTKRTLAEATKVVEAITWMNMDNYLNAYYLKNNPQIPKIGNNHYSVEQLLMWDGNPQQRTVEQKKADPKWNPMEDRF